MKILKRHALPSHELFFLCLTVTVVAISGKAAQVIQAYNYENTKAVNRKLICGKDQLVLVPLSSH